MLHFHTVLVPSKWTPHPVSADKNDTCNDAPANTSNNTSKAAPHAPTDADLTVVADAWTTLHEVVRRGIVAMVKSIG